MYGLVNRALEQLLSEEHGREKWEQIKSEAGVEEEIFLGNESYPDEMTYKLVGAAAQVTQVPASDILFKLGKYWVLHIASVHYSHFMNSGGNDLLTFLHNLPNFHNRIILVFPQLKPPEFKIGKTGENFVHLHHYSHRPGLTAFVEGLLMGLSEYFRCKIQVSLLTQETGELYHNEFLVEFKQSN